MCGRAARWPAPGCQNRLRLARSMRFAWPLRWVRRLGRGDKSLKKLADATRLERATFAVGARDDATGSRIFNDLADQDRSTGAFLAAVCPLRSRAQSEFATGHSTCVLRPALTQGPQTRPLQPVGLPDRYIEGLRGVLKGGTVITASVTPLPRREPCTTSRPQDR